MKYKASLFRELFESYDKIIVFDLETTGLNPSRDEIIDIGMVVLSNEKEEEFYSFLVKPSEPISKEITDLTHITNEMIENSGYDPSVVSNILNEIFDTKSILLIGYNVNFDLGFLFNFSKKHSFYEKIKEYDYLDVMSIFKDDKNSFPHKLVDAISFYRISGEQNSHRALDDTKATVSVFQVMLEKHTDIEKYINVFGFNPKYESSLSRLPGIEYAPQPYGEHPKIYNVVRTPDFRAKKDNFVSRAYSKFGTSSINLSSDITESLYKLGVMYYEAGEYDICSLLFQDIPNYKNAGTYLQNSFNKMVGRIDDKKMQIYLAKKAFIFKDFDVAYQRFMLANDYDNANYVRDFMQCYDIIKDYVELRCDYSKFVECTKLKVFHEVEVVFPHYQEDRKNNVANKLMGSVVSTIIYDDLSFINFVNSYHKILSELENNAVLNYLLNNFASLIEKDFKKYITKRFFDFIKKISNEKHDFLPLYLKYYPKVFNPDNDELNIYKDYPDTLFEYAMNLYLESERLKFIELVEKNQILRESRKIKQPIFMAYLLLSRYEQARIYYEEKYKEYFENYVQGNYFTFDSNHPSYVIKLLKFFPEYTSFVFNCVFKYREQSYCHFWPAKNFVSEYSKKEVIEYYEKIYNENKEELRLAQEEEKTFSNRIKIFFHGDKEFKKKYDDMIDRFAKNSAVYLFAIYYGFTLKNIEDWRERYGR